MNSSANRLRLACGLLGLRSLRISVVGHSIGSAVNIGFGPTVPRRFIKRKTGKRRPGFKMSAGRDLFLPSVAWELHAVGGYRLRSSDCARRIAREMPKLTGKTVIGASLIGTRRHLKVWFDDGGTLMLMGRTGWNLRVGRSLLSVDREEA